MNRFNDGLSEAIILDEAMTKGLDFKKEIAKKHFNKKYLEIKDRESKILNLNSVSRCDVLMEYKKNVVCEQSMTDDSVFPTFLAIVVAMISLIFSAITKSLNVSVLRDMVLFIISISVFIGIPFCYYIFVFMKFYKKRADIKLLELQSEFIEKQLLILEEENSEISEDTNLVAKNTEMLEQKLDVIIEHLKKEI